MLQVPKNAVNRKYFFNVLVSVACQLPDEATYLS